MLLTTKAKHKDAKHTMNIKFFKRGKPSQRQFERSPGLGVECCFVCTDVPTLDRFGNYGEIGKVLHLLAHLCYAA